MSIFNKTLRIVLIILGACELRSYSAESTVKVVSTTPVSGVQWHPSGKQATYFRQVSSDGVTRDVLFAFDMAAAVEKTLYDPAQDKTGARVTLNGYKWSPNGGAVLVKNQSDLWLVSLPGGTLKRLVRDDPGVELTSFSPDGSRVAFVKKNNLYAVEVSTGTVKQLTFDGSDTILNGKLDWVYGEEFEDANPSGRAFAWSPDSTQIAYLRLDQSPVPEFPIVDFLQTHATVLKQRYPKSGDANSIPAVCRVNVDGDPPRTSRMTLPAGAEYVLPELTWTPDSKLVLAMTLNRAQNELSLFAWTPATPDAPRLLFQDKDSAWINVYSGPRFLAGNPQAGARTSTLGASFVWLSERDGWLHAYLYNGDGALTRQVTRGEWMITPNPASHWSSQPVEIDPAGEWIYFSATEKDPRERHIYRARLDGKGNGVERLTKEEGTHAQKLSPDGNYILETFSSVEQPPTTRVLKADGAVLAILHQSGGPLKNPLAAFHEVAAPDGAKLYGRLIKPSYFDAEKKYPVIVDVYGGPSIQLVRNAWGTDDWLDQRLAQEGYVVWKLDNRGSFGRGHAWEKAIFKNMGAKELADQLVGIEYLKKLPFVDAERVGLHGWSYGGYMTLFMLTHEPNAFKCGAAGAPVTDWKFYDTIYTERYMRTPTENPDGYLSSSPLAAAGKLTAKLLLIHGTSDDNVHLQNTMNFLDALTKKGRAYELQIQPGQKHGFHGDRAWQYLTDRMVDFFKANL